MLLRIASALDSIGSPLASNATKEDKIVPILDCIMVGKIDAAKMFSCNATLLSCEETLQRYNTESAANNGVSLDSGEIM